MVVVMIPLTTTEPESNSSSVTMGSAEANRGEITPEWCEGWRRYLDKKAICQTRYNKKGELSDKIPISESSKQSYWAKFKACIHEAFERHVIPDDPTKGIKGFRVEQAERPYLTIEEVRRMAATPCRYPGLRRAFLFSCLSGLRKSDIIKLRWRDVVQQGEFTRIIFRQQKTKGLEYLDLSPEAVRFMGERRKPDDLVFNDFSYSASSNTELRMWAARSGVLKDFSFHCGRHTFAVLMLDLGADIFTLQKLLGHKEIHTTQVYAALLDKKKQDAVAKIPSLGLPEEPKRAEEGEYCAIFARKRSKRPRIRSKTCPERSNDEQVLNICSSFARQNVATRLPAPRKPQIEHLLNNC